MRNKHNHLALVLFAILAFVSTLTAAPVQNDHQTVSNSQKGLWQDKKRIEIEDELVLGKEFGDETEMFSYIRDLAIDHQDNLYVADSMDLCIKVFTSDGKFIRAFGREGQGPGEFQTIDAICWSQKDNCIYITDRRNHRISWFGSDGEFCGSIKTEIFNADIEGLSCLENGCFVLTARIIGDRKSKCKIIVTSHNFENVFAEIEDEFPIFSVGATISPKFSDVGILQGERIYYTSPSEYKITVLNSDFEKQTTIGKSLPRMFPPHYVRGFYVDFNAIESLLLWEDKLIVGVQSTQVKAIPKFKEKRELIEFVYEDDLTTWELKTAYQLDFFNKGFQFLGYVEVPEKRSLAGCDSSGRVYFFENEPFPRVILSWITIEDKT